MGSFFTNIAEIAIIGILVEMSFIDARTTKTFVTYNAGLLDAYPIKTTRRDLIIEGLSDIDADAVCLQSVWYSNDVKAIVNGMKAQYPYSFSDLHRADGTLPAYESEPPPCKTQEYTILTECMTSKCSTFVGDKRKLDNCTIVECTTELLDLNPRCLICLFYSKCTLSPSCCSNSSITDKVINLYGTLFLSKERITDMAVKQFNSDVEKQLDMKAQLIMRVKNIKGIIACMQLTADYGLAFRAPYLPGITSFDELNENQVKTVLKMYEKERNLILMGNFNTGPPKARAGLDATFVKSYRLIRKECMMESDLNKCTICRFNLFQIALGTTKDTVVDHIFMRGHTLIGRKRILDQTTPFALSDHYGLEVTALVRK